MTPINAIPTTRVSDQFVRTRLAEQVRSDQLALFRLQTQVSTGRRLNLPSEDPPSALRALNLQTLLERKDQVQTNLSNSNLQLANADTTLGNVTGDIASIRAAALGAADTVNTDAERQNVAGQVDELLRQMVNTSNTIYNGRYLFSGSRSLVQPFEYQGSFVKYRGNEDTLRSHVDIGYLFDTNVPGNQIFGGISSGKQGTVDLNPELTRSTRLGAVNGGKGISPNPAISITVSDGVTSSTSAIDLTAASTVGDVATLIETGAPTDGKIVVEVTGAGLRISSNSIPPRDVFVNEVASGSAARELGIYTGNDRAGAPNPTVVDGEDLNPQLQKTAQLADLLGTKARGRIVSGAVNNDILLTAPQNGTALNGVTVEFIAGGTAGSEVVTYNSGTQTLTVEVEAGASTAAQVAAAITGEGTFLAEVDIRDATSLSKAGSEPVEVTNFGVVTDGGSGTTLDQTSGLVITNGGQAQTIDISTANTVEDLLNLLNGAPLSLQAEINAAGTGINIRSRLSGADLQIGENGGTTAAELGIRTYTGDVPLADFNRGVGVVTESQRALTIELDDGLGGVTTYDIDLASIVNDELIIDVRTVDELIAKVASATGGDVTASLATVGNGLVLTDQTGAASITVRGGVAQRLGFFDESAEPQEVTSTTGTLATDDRHSLEVDSVFNTLIRLREALESNNVEAIGATIDRLDADLDRVLFARSEIGARQQALDVLQIRLEEENVQLRGALSDEIDVDLVEAISQLTSRQFALEASLRTAGSLLRLSVLDFL